MNAQRKTKSPTKVVVWVTGGQRRQNMELFARWKKVGVIVSRWWPGDGRMKWETIYSDTTPAPSHMVLLTRWMGHGADASASGVASDLGLKVVRLQHSDAHRVAETLGLAVTKPAVPTLTVVPSQKASNTRTWTVGQVLTMCRLKGEGRGWVEIGKAIDKPNKRLAKYYSALVKQYGGRNVLHAAVEAFVAGGGPLSASTRDMRVAMESQSQAPSEAAATTPAPPPLPTAAAGSEEVEEALAMAVKHSERADEAEAQVKTLEAKLKDVEVAHTTLATNCNDLSFELKCAQEALADLRAKHDAVIVDYTATQTERDGLRSTKDKVKAELKVALALLSDARSVSPDRIQHTLAFGWKMGTSGATLAAAKALLSVDKDVLEVAMAFHNSKEKA